MQRIYNTIHKHCQIDGRYGFTLPFIYKMAKDQQEKKEIKDIISAFVNAPNEHIITFCTDLDEYIIGLHKQEYSPLHMYANFGKLYYDDGRLGRFPSLEDLITLLTKKYLPIIQVGTYSKNIQTLEWE